MKMIRYMMILKVLILRFKNWINNNNNNYNNKIELN